MDQLSFAHVAMPMKLLLRTGGGLFMENFVIGKWSLKEIIEIPESMQITHAGTFDRFGEHVIVIRVDRN